MRICAPAEMRVIESRSGVSEETLMERAGVAAADEILRRFPKETKGRVAVFCGPGNNGGDGLVVARRLAEGKVPVEVFLLEDTGKPLLQLQRSRLMGVPVRPASACRDLSSFSLFVDALYGIGLDRPLRGESIERIVRMMNESNKAVVALDAPSGLNAAKGVAEGAAVKADLTLAFIAAKVGFFTAQGTDLCGEVVVLGLGISDGQVAKGSRTYRLFSARLAQKVLPQRGRAGNKSSFGHLVVCAGRPGYWGAGVLAAQAGFRVGAGYVTWAAEEAPLSELKFHPEVLTAAVGDLFSDLKKFSAFVVGPGLGVTDATLTLMERLKTLNTPVVLDADALTVLAREKSFSPPAHWILTPHAGEFARLMRMTVEEVESDRFGSVLAAAQRFGCTVLLKGFRTLVANGKRCVIVDSGNPALAKAGTGDVLAGMIGGFLAQGLSTQKAALLGAYVHGRVADGWLQKGRDVASLVASDLLDGLPTAMREVREGK